MKTKIFIVILGLSIPVKQYAQTAINRTVPIQKGQTLDMHFDYPELIKVTTWDQNEISIQGEVSINGGENDDAFTLETSTTGNVVRIRSEINDMKSLPQRVTLTRDGQKIMFRNKTEWQKYRAENGGNYNSVSFGPEIDITIEIKVPRNIATKLTSVYGMVEVQNFNGPLTVDATYGGVDAALVERSIGELNAETNFGQIYTNLELRFNGDNVTNKDFHTYVSAKPGQGPNYSFESKYGNVYLRKAEN